MGQAAEAMNFYKSVFGGELSLQTFAESGMPTSEEDKNKVIHAELKTPEITFMSSDGNAEHPVKMGDNIQMSLMGTDMETLTKYFNTLVDGGTVTMPLAKQFWGDTYGQLTDKFGIHWAVNISAEK